MSIVSKIETHLGESIVHTQSVGGGCIADARIIKTATGSTYFIKSCNGVEGMFIQEANGLKELNRPKCIRIPEVILVDHDFLLLEHIEQSTQGEHFFSNFGKALAMMHRFKSDEFGFYEDNYIGSTPQLNIAKGSAKYDWASFYFENRLLPQVKQAMDKGYAADQLLRGINQLEKRIADIIKGSEEAPTLIHGDLWSGNFLCDTNNSAVLIDPAVYYGHREAELAMTKMFGGFDEVFYESYCAQYPLKDGWKERENIYLLYHYLNHLNLFGSSYLSKSIQLLYYYL